MARRIREEAERRRRRFGTRPATGARDPGRSDPAVPVEDAEEVGRRTAAALAWLPPGWRVLRRRTTGSAVRVAVGPGGAFVVTGRRGEVEEVAAAAGPYGTHVHPVVCLLDGEVNQDGVPVDEGDGVLVCREDGLARTLAARPAVLRAAEVADLALRLETRWGVGPAPRSWRAGAPSRGALVLQVLLVLLVLIALLMAAPRLATQVTGAPVAPSPRAATTSGSPAP